MCERTREENDRANAVETAISTFRASPSIESFGNVSVTVLQQPYTTLVSAYNQLRDLAQEGAATFDANGDHTQAQTFTALAATYEATAKSFAKPQTTESAQPTQPSQVKTTGGKG